MKCSLFQAASFVLVLALGLAVLSDFSAFADLSAPVSFFTASRACWADDSMPLRTSPAARLTRSRTAAAGLPGSALLPSASLVAPLAVRAEAILALIGSVVFFEDRLGVLADGLDCGLGVCGGGLDRRGGGFGDSLRGAELRHLRRGLAQ